MGLPLSESGSQSSLPAKQKICGEQRYMRVSAGSWNKAVNIGTGCTVGSLPLVDTRALLLPPPTEPADHEVFRGAQLPGLVMLPHRLLCENRNKQSPNKPPA